MIQVSIVSGTYNRLSLLKNMVESVRACVDELSYEIVLVDGGSTDGTLEWCKEQEDVVLIEQGKLLGGAMAYNAGCAEANGEYIVILNDDIVVREGTIKAAYEYLERHGNVGQVAFHHEYQRKRSQDPRVAKALGYIYAQCCMTRKFLGDFAGWWGMEYHTYGGDTQLSMVLWEHGWKVVSLEECAVIDYEHEDQMREDRRKKLRGDPSGQNVDTQTFWKKWQGRLASVDQWIGFQDTLSYKAMKGTLKTIRIKDVPPNLPERTTMIEEFARLGDAVQLDQRKLLKEHSNNWHVLANRLEREIRSFGADLVITQVQGDNKPLIATMRTLRDSLPSEIFMVNYDGDARFPLRDYHYQMAKICDMQLVSSSTALVALNEAGYYNTGWFLGSAEGSYFNAKRKETFDYDIVFLANYYGDSFPEGETRKTAIETLLEAGLNVDLFGGGWRKAGLKSHRRTDEQHDKNIKIYTGAKLALSISAFVDLYGYTSDRLWMICATGCPALVQRFDGMEELGFVDGKTCIAWTSLNELAEKAKYALENDDWREEIGRNGRELMLARHTYEHRVAELLSMLEPLEEVSCFKTQMY